MACSNNFKKSAVSIGSKYGKHSGTDRNSGSDPAFPARQCMLQQRLFAVRKCKRH